VGDVIVYQPASTGGARIIHRVIGGDADAGWQMQGDNNDFVDPFTPRGEEVVGVAQLHVPRIGMVGAYLTSPVIWLSVIALALALLLWPQPERDDDAADGDAVDADAVENDAAAADPVEADAVEADASAEDVRR
jgi:signal peptidase